MKIKKPAFINTMSNYERLVKQSNWFESLFQYLFMRSSVKWEMLNHKEDVTWRSQHGWKFFPSWIAKNDNKSDDVSVPHLRNKRRPLLQKKLGHDIPADPEMQHCLWVAYVA